MVAQVVQNKRGLGPASNEMRPHRNVYEFSADGGVVGDTYELFEADRDMIIVDGNIDVKEALTGGAGATIIIGVLGGDVDALLASTLMAALTVDDQLPLDAASKNFLVKKGEKIILSPGVNDLTAGKLEVVLYSHSR